MIWHDTLHVELVAVGGYFGFVLNDHRVALFLGYEWFIFSLPKIEKVEKDISVSGRENKLNIDTDLNSVRVSLYLIHSGRDK